jgi:O-antigen ligase
LSLAPHALIATAFVLVGYGTVAGTLRISAAITVLLVAVAVVLTKPALGWRGPILGLLLVILFVPIRRYVLSGGMPFQLEPYRLYVMLLVGAWVLALLVDSRVSLRRTGFEAPLLFLVAATFASVLANPGRVGSLATPVLKSFTFFLSFVLIFYLLVSVIRTRVEVERMVRALVIGGAIISASAIVELRTGINVFASLDRFLPFLESTVPTELERSGLGRAFGPAQHPIALGAVLTMLVPLAAYVASTSRSRWWWFVCALLVLGNFATVSRTSIVMLVVVLLFYLRLYPRQTRRLWPLAIPVVVAVHFLLPGTIGTLKAYFLPSGGIVQQQTVYNAHVDLNDPRWCDIAPRLARIEPMLAQWRERPIFGQGYSTRITDGPGANTCVLDDQWLGTLLETGVVGIAAWWWLIIAFVRRAMRAARAENSRRARLLGALGTSVGALAVGMFFFDALSFIQLAFFLFIYLAFGSILLLQNEEEEEEEVDAVVVPLVRRSASPSTTRRSTHAVERPVASHATIASTDRRPRINPVIGVVCAEIERPIVREFFELFKVPWSFYKPGDDYDVLIVTAAAGDVRADARIMFAFGSTRMPIDERTPLAIGTRLPPGQVIRSEALSIPLQGTVLTFRGLVAADSPQAQNDVSAVVRVETADGTIVRFGYDLFGEVGRLLGEGQEARNAGIATLDCHIELLRRWLVGTVGLLVEIPPVRAGHPYAVSLTHDIDFLALRRHRFDRTLLGFLYRGTIGSLSDFLTGRGGLRRLMRNWLTVASLPLVHLGVRADPWQPFASYAEADGARSTFFVIPFRDHGGEGLEAEQARRRQVGYDVDDVSSTLRALREDGCEVAVHGIDGWHNATGGRAERERVSAVIHEPSRGVRMHWLCFDAKSYKRLEEAGYDYDATCGYNDAVGFKAGTTQVFKPLDVDHLLELPLHVQDTALFYSRRLHMSQRSAWKATEALRGTVQRSGGVLTVSWHDRSLAPERLWDHFYLRLLAALRSDGAWFGTAREVVDWFRLRRSVSLGCVDLVSSRLKIEVFGTDPKATDAGLLIRVHLANGNGATAVDVPWRGEPFIEVPVPVAWPEVVRT